MDDRHNKTDLAHRERGHDGAHAGESKPSYRSYKKKYRKLRLQFDQNVQESEELHRTEQKAIRTMKRLAIENEYVCAVEIMGT